MFTPCTILLLITIDIISSSSATSSLPKWGTLRPHNLIAARAPVPNSPYFGFVYHPATSTDVRHLAADHTDKIKTFSYNRHDGENFGVQEIKDQDANLLLTTTFYAHPSNKGYTIRLNGQPLDPSKSSSIQSVILYSVIAPDDKVLTKDSNSDLAFGSLKLHDDDDRDSDHVHIHGHSKALDSSFSIHMNPPMYGSVSLDSLSSNSNNNNVDSSGGGTGSRSKLRLRSDRPVSPPEDLNQFHKLVSNDDANTAWAIEKNVQKKLKRQLKISKSFGKLNLFSKPSSTSEGNSIYVQRLVEVPFQLEANLVIEQDSEEEEEKAKILNDISSENKLDTEIQALTNQFNEKFEDIFRLKQKGFSKKEIEFGKFALSNILGGLGYFYGSSISIENEKTNLLAPVGLYTATPSRIVFPRGFLWDEGFHQLIIQYWNNNITINCLQSWFDASQPHGWIPREQILGSEARDRFPTHIRHLILQDPIVANPPTILMPLFNLWKFSGSSSNKDNKNKKQMDTLLNQAIKYYEWIKNSQSGNLPLSFRWHGRSSELQSSGYPLTLSSGLDDYPRSDSISDNERHVDLHCWITWALGIIIKIKKQNQQDFKEYENEYNELIEALDRYHSIDENERKSRDDFLFCDFDGDQRVCNEGYVTILPLLLGLLDENDDRVGTILDSISDENNLNAIAGIRSLSRMNQFHRKGDDYWTGSIWMPFNYLTLASLKMKYAKNKGKYQDRASQLYSSLRASIIQNTIRVYEETGVLWENYSPDEDGNGKSGRQFTGWTSLILLIMAEKYDGIIL